ncbi:hypothetical protein [Streptomyces sp. MJM1172]|uniref:hypothetical protein n=1 Tax=Streptomyces sp. MJM1172 TaxID=1703926 RepID=UPI00093AFE04|nr:hypothetical protein [Streptomyces sp. MJM1172]OKI52991.1 hypothetical protein AMK15_29465 [Streptomyces sp. MJM1172]
MIPGPRAPFGLAATILAIPAAVSLIDPAPAVLLYSAELGVLLLAFATAVWAPAPASDRAFRLLRWMTGKPEPAAPEPVSTAPAAPAPAATARRGAGLSAPTRDRPTR